MYLLAWIFIAVLVGWGARRMLEENSYGLSLTQRSALLQSGVLETRCRHNVGWSDWRSCF